MSKLICPECQRLNLTSTVTSQGSSTTLMGFFPWYDTEGEWHEHDPNRVTESLRCSNGHQLRRQIPNTCRCGWVQDCDATLYFIPPPKPIEYDEQGRPIIEMVLTQQTINSKPGPLLVDLKGGEEKFNTQQLDRMELHKQHYGLSSLKRNGTVLRDFFGGFTEEHSRRRAELFEEEYKPSVSTTEPELEVYHSLDVEEELMNSLVEEVNASRNDVVERYKDKIVNPDWYGTVIISGSNNG